MSSYQPLMYEKAEEYDEGCIIQIALAKKTLAKYFANIYNGLAERKIKGHVLDVACGTGRVTKTVLVPQLDATATLDACDISQEVLDYAARKYKDINFFQQNIIEPFPEKLTGHYDFIFSNCMLHWVKNQRSAFLNLHTLLNEGGSVAVSMMGRHPMYDIYREMVKLEKWRPYMHDIEKFISPYHDDKDADITLKNLMLECGFKNVHVELVSKDADEITYKIFTNNFKKIDPFLHRIPDEEKELYMTTFIQKFLDIGGLIDYDPKTYKGGPVVVGGYLIIAIAEK